MYTVSITRLHVRSLRYLPLFLLHAFRSGSQTRTAEGMLGFDSRTEGGRVFWTRTIWNSEADMKRYRSSGAHQLAMRILARACDEASYTRWQQESAELPGWEEAHRRLLAQGQLSKVRQPSALHQAGHPAPPLDGAAA